MSTAQELMNEAPQNTKKLVRRFKRRQYGLYSAMLACTGLFAGCVLLSFFGAAFGMSDQMAGVLSMVITVMLYPALLGVFGLIGIKNRKKMIAKLQERELLELAAYEMLEGKTQPFTRQGLISDHFIFSRKKRGTLVLCEDVLWFYTTENKRKYGVVLGTRYDGQVPCFAISCREDVFQQEADACVAALRQRTGNLLVGDTPENKDLYWERTRS